MLYCMKYQDDDDSNSQVSNENGDDEKEDLTQEDKSSMEYAESIVEDGRAIKTNVVGIDAVNETRQKKLQFKDKPGIIDVLC